MLGLVKKIFGDFNEKEIKRMNRTVEIINRLEPDFEKLSDEQLKGKTDEFKARLAGKEDLDDILPEAFAAVREASRRTLNDASF